MSCKVDLSNLIMQEAQAQGVDTGIALAVARTESGVCQWRPDGSVVTSSAGAIGVFQLMPATAAGLGVDPNDVSQNIQGGITYLKQLYEKYGSWPQALAAYNWGPTKVDNSGGSWPSTVVNYVKGILGIGTVYNAALTQMQSDDSESDGSTTGNSPITASDILADVIPDGSNVTTIACLALAGFAIAVVWLRE